MLWAHILSANLKNARSRRTRESEDRREVEVVCEDGVTVLPRPLDNFFVRRPRITHGSPMNGFDGVFSKDIHPARRQVDVDNELQFS